MPAVAFLLIPVTAGMGAGGGGGEGGGRGAEMPEGWAKSRPGL